jgi:hypothetical protein
VVFTAGEYIRCNDYRQEVFLAPSPAVSLLPTDAHPRTAARAGCTLAAAVAASRCVPAAPAAERLIGRWQVEWDCGQETLDLRSDKSYTQSVEYAAGGSAMHSGAWRTTTRKSLLQGEHVVLENAIQFCDAFGRKLSAPERADRELETVWEWGRLTLVFNPDVPGYTRR